MKFRDEESLPQRLRFGTASRRNPEMCRDIFAEKERIPSALFRYGHCEQWRARLSQITSEEPSTDIEASDELGGNMKRSLLIKVTSALGIGVVLALVPAAEAAVQRVKYQSGNNYLIVEVLTDDLVHFEVSGLGPGPDAATPIFTSPQVFKTDYAGPSTFSQSGSGGHILDPAHAQVVVDSTSLG